MRKRRERRSANSRDQQGKINTSILRRGKIREANQDAQGCLTSSMPHPRDLNIVRVVPTPLYNGYEKLVAPNPYNRSVFINYRKSIIENLKLQRLKPNDTDLYKVLELAFKIQDNEIIDVILSQYPPKVMNSGKLFDFILQKYLENKNTPLWKSFLVEQPHKKKISEIVRSTLDYKAVSLKFDQKKQLLEIATNENDYDFVHTIISAPNKNNRNASLKSKALFGILKKKINEYYASYNNDRKSLFRLVALKQVIENDTTIDYSKIKIKSIRPLISQALLHGNIQFIEMWLKKKPEILQDLEFKNLVHTKYVDCLRSLLLDSDSRSGYGIGAITAILDSKVVQELGLESLNLSQQKLQEIYSDIAPQWRDALKAKLKKYNVIFKIPEKLIQGNSSEDWAIKCLNGDVADVEQMIASGLLDLSKIRFQNQTLLYYAASYKRGGQNDWPYSTLQLPIDMQLNDAGFQILSRNKNRIISLLLKQYEFTKEDVQAAFNIAYQDGIVKRDKPSVFNKAVKKDQNLETKYALRGDHGILKKLIQAGADLSIGKSFMGIYKAIAISYVSALSADFILGVTTELIQEYLKVPANRWYQHFAAWISASTSAYTFEKTGVVIEYYHRTLNPDYLSNNLLDLSNVIVAGTHTSNWYGGLVFGNNLQSKISGKTGITGTENAIFDVDDITHRNIAKHWEISTRLFCEYKMALEKGSKAKWRPRVKGYEKLIDGLEEMNKACCYGIPGDNKYSFNNAFQQKLRDLLLTADQTNLINSIIIFKRNRLFFLDFAKGVDQGLIKVPLELKLRILDINHKISERIVRPVQSAPQQNLHMLFGELVNMYSQHTKSRIPLSVLMVAQTYEQRRITGIDVHLSPQQRVWKGFVWGYDSVLACITPRFGITKERGHELVAQSLSRAMSLVIGGANYYEKKIRSEIVKQGVLSAASQIATLAFTSMATLWTMGYSPFLGIVTTVSALCFLYCRQNDIHPTEPFMKMYKAFKEASMPRPDRQGVFIRKETMDSFKRLFKSYQIDSIPEVVHCSL